MKTRAPKSLMLAFYGDDFTGSTDVMESLAGAGLKTVLFLAPPSPAQLQSFPGLRAFGIAGGTRAMSRAEMKRELPPAFRALKASNAPIIHYKTCSTFDSSPTIGSIGYALELGRRVFGERCIPLVVGVPVLGRYVVFGNLFARSGLDSEPTRLDRHPTMSRHPVTPMDESDLRVHLNRQTDLPIELIDILTLRALGRNGGSARGRTGDPKAEISSGFLDEMNKSGNGKRRPIVLLDLLAEEDLAIIGRLLAREVSPGKPLFCAGSSGIEYALLAHWRTIGRVPAKTADVHRHRSAARSSKQIVVISGSCSPVTDRQIGRALEVGFFEVACDSERLADPRHQAVAIQQALATAHVALAAGRNVIFHTARGPLDSRYLQFARGTGKPSRTKREERISAGGARLAVSLAEILESALRLTKSRRAVVCGGDTSTHVARFLGMEALEFVAPVAPGAPLCRVHAPGRIVHGCEIVFKGGQIGRDAFFSDLV